MKHNILARLVALSLGFFAMTETTLAQSTSGALSAPAIEEVFNQSLAQKKGMSIYIGGQVINAILSSALMPTRSRSRTRPSVASSSAWIALMRLRFRERNL